MKSIERKWIVRLIPSISSYSFYDANSKTRAMLRPYFLECLPPVHLPGRHIVHLRQPISILYFVLSPLILWYRAGYGFRFCGQRWWQFFTLWHRWSLFKKRNRFRSCAALPVFERIWNWDRAVFVVLAELNSWHGSVFLHGHDDSCCLMEGLDGRAWWDVFCSYNENWSILCQRFVQILGRSESGTVRISQHTIGLWHIMSALARRIMWFALGERHS